MSAAVHYHIDTWLVNQIGNREKRETDVIQPSVNYCSTIQHSFSVYCYIFMEQTFCPFDGKSLFVGWTMKPGQNVI